MGITPRWAFVTLIAYLAAVGIVLLLPVGYSGIVRAIGDFLADTFGLRGFGTGWIEFAANVVIFIPLGLLLTVLFRRHVLGFVLAVMLSVLAELAQSVIPGRQPSLRDVLANGIGAALGAGIAWLIIRRRPREPRTATTRAR